ncbi:MAG TPA: UDP-N-acetylglucosamine--N-acetylmuramyl-(pentapeptide) pyrophosphoryl-undecaprenol N-acetylglucosamine transferase [Opitutaceae bacterium]|jgi:UDP-N-acetylglucosamine--N-acetylmuramyl-(pentapeptide) pyrophosphoryl-undecaprenol N-acetylglucosamine transferase
MSRFLISCGGTGGHLSPGISLAEGLLSRGHEARLLISRKRVDSRLAEKYPQLRFERMPGSGFSWHPARMARFGVAQVGALRFCMGLVKSFRPDVVVGFGGFTSAPAAVAARLHGIPMALHEANRVPGLAVRSLGRIAGRVYLPIGIRIGGVRAAATRHVGLPVRREISRMPAAEARRALGLDPEKKVLVVLGGSQGASPLNGWARQVAEALAQEGVQLYCVAGLGKSEAETVSYRSKSGDETKAVFVPFCDQIAAVLSAADLVVSRAGAGTLAELVRCEVPAILVPYPHAASDHQRANAAFFERQGGGIVVEEASIHGLLAEALEVVFNDWLLRQFRGNLRRMDRSNSLDLMLADLESMARSGSDGRMGRALRAA